jgi:hypothetical protein
MRLWIIQDMDNDFLDYRILTILEWTKQRGDDANIKTYHLLMWRTLLTLQKLVALSTLRVGRPRLFH